MLLTLVLHKSFSIEWLIKNLMNEMWFQIVEKNLGSKFLDKNILL